MNAIEIRGIFYENYYKRIGFSKEESYCPLKSLKKERLFSFANKLIKYVADFRNAKEHYESFLRKKKRRSVKQSEVIKYQPKIFDTVDIRSDITEHRKISRKLSKVIWQAEKVSSNNSFYSDTKKRANFLNEQNVKITKRELAFKGYACSYNVEILSSFNPKIKLKDTESAIKSKLIELLSQLRGFNFVKRLVFSIEKDRKKR